MFPAAVDQSQLSAKSYVFGLRVQGAAKAWPLASFAQEPVINDDIGGLPVVLIGDPATRSVRAYERGDREFVGRDGEILAGDLSRWQITEDALVGPDQRLPRMAGHIAYWFAWDNYLGAETEVYGQQANARKLENRKPENRKTGKTGKLADQLSRRVIHHRFRHAHPRHLRAFVTRSSSSACAAADVVEQFGNFKIGFGFFLGGGLLDRFAGGPEGRLPLVNGPRSR